MTSLPSTTPLIIPAFCTSVLLTYATYRRFKERENPGGYLVLSLSAVATIAMWTSTIALTLAYFSGAVTTIGLGLLSLMFGMWFSAMSSAFEADAKVRVAVSQDFPFGGVNSAISLKQAQARQAIEIVGMVLFVVSGIVSLPWAVPLIGCYLGFVSCQLVWNFGLSREFKNRVKGCFGLGKPNLLPEGERLERTGGVFDVLFFSAVRGEQSSAVPQDEPELRRPATPGGFTVFGGEGRALRPESQSAAASVGGFVSPSQPHFTGPAHRLSTEVPASSVDPDLDANRSFGVARFDWTVFRDFIAGASAVF